MKLSVDSTISRPLKWKRSGMVCKRGREFLKYYIFLYRIRTVVYGCTHVFKAKEEDWFLEQRSFLVGCSCLCWIPYTRST